MFILSNIQKSLLSVSTTTATRRDPYTAVHQQRAARLACAIAREMDLSGRLIEGIRIAGILHDIGKIYVPAEILNKPGQLTETEIDLIKTHPQIGYEILRGIEFPWPVAQIVLQHHEKINGSGYPSNLSGKDILLEARIPWAWPILLRLWPLTGLTGQLMV